MTDSSASRRPRRLVVIHGLNNNAASFAPLIAHFQRLGVRVDFVVLPGHGDGRLETGNLDEALRAFSERMEPFRGTPFSVLSFSHGALYLQLWLMSGGGFSPERQVLLAPALYLRREPLVCALLKLLPASLPIKSLSPSAFRRYDVLRARDYQVLVRGMRRFRARGREFPLPTLTLIDPRDELVDARALRAHHPQTVFVERPQLRGVGAHHILFHPDYFTPHEWTEFTARLEEFLLGTTGS